MSSMSTHRIRSVTASLPRFSLAALMIALALAAGVSAVVGIAAWSIQTGDPGVSQVQLQAAEKAAFERGHVAGYKEGLTKGKQNGATIGERRGHRNGFGEGLRKGVRKGYAKGHEAGYSEGYSAGAAAAKPAQGSGKKKAGGT
jgi:flagellar biosynthesis/type III secretory pathway protein FliH